jgi:hypothetical protein
MRIAALSASLLATGVLFVTSTSAQGFQPGGPLVVRDGKGTLVGQYLSGGQVSMKINGKPYIADVSRSTLGGTILFDQPNCQGNAFIGDRGENTIENRVARGPGGVLFTADVSGSWRAAVSASYFSVYAGCSNNIGSDFGGFPATASTVNVKTTFQPLFSIDEGQVGTPVAVPIDNVGFLVTLALVLAIAGLVGIRRLL